MNLKCQISRSDPIAFIPVNFPDDGTYLSDKHKSPKYWLLPSSTAAKSFHSSTGPAKSTEFSGSWYSPTNKESQD